MRKSLAVLALALTGLVAAGLFWKYSRLDTPLTENRPEISVAEDQAQSRSPDLGNTAAANAGTVPSPVSEDRVELAELMPLAASIAEGDQILIPLSDREQVTGVVHLVLREENGTVRVGGRLVGDRPGTFSLHWVGGELNGRILIPGDERAYVLSTNLASVGPDGIVDLPMGSVICYPMPRASASVPASSADLVQTEPQGAPPILSSRPDADDVVYLHFVSQEDVDGGFTVTDPDWNGGDPIVPAKSPLNNAQIEEAWNRIKEDFWPFDLDITTDPSRYDGAAVGHRMRVIITPTDTAGSGSGGVAWLESFTAAGVVFSDTVPAWVFTTTAATVAEAVSHEVGHTFALSHDGLANGTPGNPDDDTAYFSGQGAGPTSWAPIMGSGYTRNVVQWSKGEYPDANNQEDDIAIISGAETTPFNHFTNPFGFVADEAGNDRLSAADAYALIDGANQLEGIIASDADVDFYSFSATEGATVTLTAVPATYSPDLDITLRLYDNSGTLLETNSPTANLSAEISRVLSAGDYTVSVEGSGDRDVNVDGYSNYGSSGYYQLTFDGIDLELPPTIAVDPATQAVAEGEGVTLSVSVSGTGPFTYQWYKGGMEISGATSSSYTISSLTPNDAGAYAVVVTNAYGDAMSSAANLTVNWSRLTALSIRGLAGAGDNTLITGMVIGGGLSKGLVLRAQSSILADLMVPGVLADPRLTLYQYDPVTTISTQVGENDNWGGDPTTATRFASVGLSPLAEDSLDAAFATEIDTGIYTAHVTGAAGTGVVILELYDYAVTNYASRLQALSLRGSAGTGDNIMIVGIVIEGNSPARVVVRGVGPSLGAAVPQRMLDPEMLLFHYDPVTATSTQIGENDNWGGGTELTDAFSTVGLFALDPASADAAMLLDLDPGIYTVQIRGVGNTTGVVLMELYEVP